MSEIVSNRAQHGRAVETNSTTISQKFEFDNSIPKI